MKLRELILVLPLLFTSCEKVSTLSGVCTGDVITQNDVNAFVGIEDIRKYASLNVPPTKGNLDYTIDAIVGEEADTLMYVINYGGGNGWRVISADKRTPAVIAEGDRGRFSLENGSPSMELWLEDIKRTMARIRESSNDALAFSESEISANVSAWTGNSIDKVVPTPDPIENGHWQELIISSEEPDVIVSHMVPKWDQGFSYNLFCPYQSDDSGSRAPAGCVAVAGAQVLYYLHNKINQPTYMVSQGSCVGNIHNYVQTFSSYSSTIWDSMSPNFRSYGTNAEALLIGYVGKVVNMHYHNTYSWAFPRNLKDDLFSSFGISSQRDNYDENVVKQSLESDMPVIISAADHIIPSDFDIHCFVIDGYKKTHKEYSIYHYWVPDDPSVDGERIHPSYYTYSTGPSEITAVRINWGWWTQWLPDASGEVQNDGWYSLTGNWLTDGDTTWDRHRVMIYGFEYTGN
ncbi:MAG: C10 family peptidase [Bacteroidales bacterium]|nr:C10 family peptidase [Bacteroidales bacterium]